MSKQKPYDKPVDPPKAPKPSDPTYPTAPIEPHPVQPVTPSASTPARPPQETDPHPAYSDPHPSPGVHADIVLEESNGQRRIVPNPTGEVKARIHGIDGKHYEHTSEDAEGRWVYKAL